MFPRRPDETALAVTRGGGGIKITCFTCVLVPHMAKMIQVRKVPEDVHRTLKARAAAAGMSLSTTRGPAATVRLLA